MNRIAILDYGIGNVRSISNALEKIGASPLITRNKKEVLESDSVILPGVGAFAPGMENLTKYNLIDVINEYIATGKPFLGICLGMQLLLDKSDEFGSSTGLGIIKGKVKKLPEGLAKLPHVAWSEILPPHNERWNSTILQNAKQGQSYYFVHTFVAEPFNENEALALTSFNGEAFCSAIHKENVYGVQFHPEKSGKYGLQILKNFAKIS